MTYTIRSSSGMCRSGSSRREARRHLRKGLALAVTCGALLASTAVDALAGSAVMLRYGMRSGAVYDHSVTLRGDSLMKIEGIPQLEAQVGEGLRMGMDMSMEISTSMGKTSSDQSIPLEVRLDDFQMRAQAAGQRSAAGSEALPREGLVVPGSLNPDRRSVRIDQEALARLPEGIGQFLANSAPILPKSLLQVGKSFESETASSSKMNLPTGGEQKVDLKSKATYTLVKVEDKQAHFDVENTVTGGAQGEEGMEVTVSGSGFGTAIFSLTEGIFLHLESEDSLEMTLSISGEKVAEMFQGRSSEPITVSMNMKARMEMQGGRKR